MTGIRITVKVPQMVLNSAQVRAKILQTMRTHTGPDLRREFKKTVEGWETAPDFDMKFLEHSGSLATQVFPVGSGKATYELVNEGSPAHTITPRRGGALRFQTGYRSATSPRTIGSRAKSRSGPFVSAGIVHHPGFEARKFDETIADDYTDTFEQDIQDAINSAVP